MSEKSINRNLTKIKDEMEEELSRILSFWSSEAIDNRNGGFIGQIGHSGNKDWEAPKGVVLNSRILWTFSAAYLETGIQKYRELADRAYEYLMNQFWDEENGGFYWTLDYKGNPLNTRKQGYAQAFGIYALSEYNRATGNDQSLEYAIILYEILEKRYRDNIYSGYIECLKEDWSQMGDMRLSEKDINSPKSMNTHLHILEAYTNLFRVWTEPDLKKSLSSLLIIFKDRIFNHQTAHLNLFFSMDWNLESSLVSFGHDIEAAWLMHEAAIVLGDQNLIDEIQNVSIRLVDQTIQEGFDGGSSVFYEREGNEFDTDKHWWPQAEAMVGLMDAFEISQEDNYLDIVENFWTFIKNNLLDTVNGEWFWSVDINGNANKDGDKLGIWKCPYHNARALMEMSDRITKFI